jgi:mRNA-degrading endonuclease HigB of HigAB toxin-antitoxin module
MEYLELFKFRFKVLKRYIFHVDRCVPLENDAVDIKINENNSKIFNIEGEIYLLVAYLYASTVVYVVEVEKEL